MAEKKKAAVGKKDAGPSSKARPSNIWAASENALEVNGECFCTASVRFFLKTRETALFFPALLHTLGAVENHPP